MGWFGKKDTVIDLSAKYKKDQEKIANIQQEQSQPESPAATGLGFFGAIAKTTSSNNKSEPIIDLSATDERKKRLAKRLTDMTEKLEDISNQIYHLQQRVEVIERKNQI